MELGNCPICSRIMIEGDSVNEHHFTPKCKGGKEKTPLHRICHTKIHSLFSESELANYYNTPERLKEHEDIQKFIKWVSKKDPEFYESSKKANRKKR